MGVHLDPSVLYSLDAVYCGIQKARCYIRHGMTVRALQEQLDSANEMTEGMKKALSSGQIPLASGMILGGEIRLRIRRPMKLGDDKREQAAREAMENSTRLKQWQVVKRFADGGQVAHHALARDILAYLKENESGTNAEVKNRVNTLKEM